MEGRRPGSSSRPQRGWSLGCCVLREAFPCDNVLNPRPTSAMPTKPQYMKTVLAVLGRRCHPARGRLGGASEGRRRAALPAGGAGAVRSPSPPPPSVPDFASGRNLRPEPGSTWWRARDGWARLGSSSAGRFHPYRAPGQWHVRHGVQGLRQGGCGRAVPEVSRRRTPGSCAHQTRASAAG